MSVSVGGSGSVDVFVCLESLHDTDTKNYLALELVLVQTVVSACL